MGRISKTFTLLLTLTIMMSCLTFLTVKPENAQSTPNPSVPIPSIPEFSVKFVNASYEIPASSTINPYTGQNETSPSSYIENYSIQVIVKNQPFTPQWIPEGNSGFIPTLYYNVRMKGYFEDNWRILYSPDTDYPTQSNSDYTTVYSEEFNPNGLTTNYQIDFQVQALIGAVHRGYNASATNQLDMYPYVFDGQASAWSNTQTLTIPVNSASPIPSPTPTPDLPRNPPHLEPIIYLIPISIIVVIVVLSVLLYRRHRKTANLSK